MPTDAAGEPGDAPDPPGSTGRRTSSGPSDRSGGVVDPRVPAKGRAAALLFIVAGLGVLLSTWVGGVATGAPALQLAGPVIRGLALIVIAWGLLRSARWAWLLGLIFPGFWILMGGIGVARADLSAVSTASWITVVGILLLMAAGWALLLAPEVRRTYRRGAGR